MICDMRFTFGVTPASQREIRILTLLLDNLKRLKGPFTPLMLQQLGDDAIYSSH